MIEIVPNWHPVFVHFTVALLSVAALFFLAAWFAASDRWRRQWAAVAYWNLWIGTVLTAATVAAGWYAFDTVTHDDPSHTAMLAHRNWAIPTFAAFVALGVWGWRDHRKTRGISTAFLLATLAGTGLLLSTAWHGAELVYRHGLGVMSLPKAEAGDHAHEHSGGHDAGASAADTAASAPKKTTPRGHQDDGHTH